MPYTAGFKAQMVKKLLGPPAITAQSLSKQVGVPQPTLSKWLREAATVGRMGSDEQKPKAVAGPKKWTAAEKLRVVAAAEGLEGPALGELLRREGLHEEQLRSWRGAAAEALDGTSSVGTSEDVGDRRAGPRKSPKNKLSVAERKRLLELVNSEEFRDLSPKQIVPRLADQGLYVASEATVYRVLREEGQLGHRVRLGER